MLSKGSAVQATTSTNRLVTAQACPFQRGLRQLRCSVQVQASIYTTAAQQAIRNAQQEACRQGSMFLAPPHLIQGLLDTEGCSASEVLNAAGMTAAVAEEAFVDKQMVPTHSVMSAGDLHWAPDARKALQIAAELCIYTGHSAAGTPHLLLGVLDCKNAAVLKALEKAGVNLAELRSKAEAASKTCDEPAAATQPAAPPETQAAQLVDQYKQWVAQHGNEPPSAGGWQQRQPPNEYGRVVVLRSLGAACNISNAAAAAIGLMAADVLKKQPGLLGDATRPGLQTLSRLVTDAEASLQAGHLQLAQSCLDTYFAETSRRQGSSAKSVPVDQFACRAHFAAGQLISKLSSSYKGKQLVDAVLEAVDSIMRGVEIAAANPRYSHLVYNGSVHYWHVASLLQCDKLRHHLLPSQEKLCQALEKVEEQQAWRVRHLLSLALCQGSEEGKPEEVPKTLAKALELATAANLQPLRAEVLALQTHHQTVQAAKAAASKPAGAAGAGGKGAATAAPAPPAALKQAVAPAGKRKPGEPAVVSAGKADVDGALALLQWVLSAKPDATVAEQQLQAAVKLVDIKPDKPGNDAHLYVVGRIGWAAAVSGATQLAEQCTRRAAASQELGPRVWADLTRLLLSLKAAPEGKLGMGSDSSGSSAALDAPALTTRREVLDGADEAASAFLKLGDVEGIHNAAVLAWNAGLPLLQPSHRSLVKPAFTAVAKALEAVGSPWTKLRAALHLEVAKAEADADSFVKAAKEVSTALSLNYPSSADMAAVCGYERALDRHLEPMARAAQLRGVAPVQLSSSSGGASGEGAVRPDDDVVLLLERAKDSKSAPLRSECLQKAVNKLALLPAQPAPPGPATTEVLQQQLRAARTRTQLWADVVELAWRPCQLDAIVRSALPYVLEPNWHPCGDKEMLVLQARMALVGAEAAKVALSKLDAELVVPPGYTPSSSAHSTDSTSTGSAAGTGQAVGVADGSKGKPASASQTKGQEGTAAEVLQRLVADYLLQSMQLSVAAGNMAWLVMNAAMAAWNTYLPLMQKERYADLAGLLLPVLKALLQEPSTLQPNQLVMLAEAAAKAAEHVAVLSFLQLQQEKQQERPSSMRQQQDRPQSVQSASATGQTLLPSALPWYKPFAEARAATAGLDVTATLATAPDALQLLSDTAAACQTASTRAATAAEPQGLIQSYARLQQLQGKPVTVPPGAPASMADTSKLLVLIEALTAAAPSSKATAGAPTAAAAAGAVTGRAGSAGAPGGPAAARPSAAGGKGAPATPAMSKAEQDIRSAMALLTAMPTVNLQLWAQLSRAAGWHGYWLLARECANAALGALPADKRELAAIAAASEVPDLGAQGWYWLSVAEMQQGQAVLSLLPSSGNTASCSLSLQHSALQHFATAVRLASFIRRADLAEAAARLAHNTVIAPGGLLETNLTRAAAVKELTIVANSLNAARPAEIGFQVKVNLLQLECLSAAGRWQEARRHVEALHRSLPVAKQRGPAAAAALEAIAGWRATCLVEASTRALEEMPRLLSELNTPQAKARAWLAFAQATPSIAEQLQARQSALAALDTLPPEAKVEYQLEFAEWLASCTGQLKAGAADTAPPCPEQLLLQAVSALEHMQPAGSLQGVRSGMSTASVSRGLPTTADRTVPVTAAAAGAGRHARASMDAWGGPSPVSSGRRLEQLLRVQVMLSQVAADAEDRRQHLLQAQACAEQLLTSSLLAAGAELPPLPSVPEQPMAASASGEAPAGDASSSISGSISSSGAATAVPGADVASSGGVLAAVAAAAAAKQPAVPALPLPMLTRPGTSATAAAGTARSAMSSRGIAKASQLPSSPLEWATWQPDAAVVEKLKELAAAADVSSIQSSAGSRSRPGSVQTGAPGSSGMHDAWGLSGAQTGVALGKSCMQAPELLLANLRVLAEQLQAAGCHVAALPVLHLARLVALVTLGSEAEAAVAALELSSVCEQLGLPAAAVDWLQLAAPERWPNPEQQQQAEASKAMQQLSTDVLLSHSKRMARSWASRPQSASRAKSQTEQQQPKSDLQGSDSMAFLLEALDGVEPGTLQSWMRASLGGSNSDGDGSLQSAAGGSAPSTWGSRVGSAQGRSRPASTPGTRAAAAAAALSAGQGSSLRSSVVVLQVQPTKPLDSWVNIARYLVDRAQYTAGQKLCSVALEMARSSGDVKNQAEVLLLQARLALLAQHFQDAVKLSQAAQELGGSVQLWRDSVLCYAAARSRMAGRGPADALEALEGGVAVVATVARGHAPAFKPTLLEASARLKLQLAQELTSRAQHKLSEAQRDPSCLQAAVQQHCRAMEMCKEAAHDAQQAGAVLLEVQALQTAAGLLVSKEHAAVAAGQQQQQQQQQSRQQKRQGSRCGVAQRDSGMVLLPRGQAAALESVGLLEAALDALAAVPDDGHGPQLLTLCSRPTTSQLTQRTDTQLFSGSPIPVAASISSSGAAAVAGTAAATSASTATAMAPAADAVVGCQQQQPDDAGLPTARAAASVLVQLSEAELLAARLELQEGKGGKAAVEPEFPRVDGRDPQAVIAYLSAAAADGQAATAAKVDYLASALQHAEQAAEAAAASGQPGTHAAASLALGKAHMLQAHAVMLEQQLESGAAFLRAASNSGGHSSETDVFDAAWLPWPGQLAYSSGAKPAAAAQAGTDRDAPTENVLGASGDGQVLSASGAIQASTASTSGTTDTEPQGNELAATQQPPDSQGDSLASTHTEVQLPPEAVQSYLQAIQILQEAVQAALQLQQLTTAETAARALAHCYGHLQPEQTAWYLAVAQSCSSAGAMRGSFEQAAALQHAEVLLWRQLQQLEHSAGPDSVHKAQVQQLLSLLGITSKRLQVPQPTTLKPLLSQLQPNQRLLMLHHDPQKQQLVLAAWGVPGAKLSAEAQAALATATAAAEAAAAAVAAAATAAGTGAAKAPSASGGGSTARGRKSAAAGPALPADDPAAIAAAAAAAAAAAVPPAAVLTSMPCSQQQLSELTAAFAAYSKALQKAIAQVTSQPVSVPAADATAAAAATVTATTNGAKKGAGGAAAKGAAKDKGAKDAGSDAPSWVPPTPVFPQEMNEQWQQLMQQFEDLLQPVSALLQDTLKLQPPPAQPAAAPAPAKQGKTTSTSGGKASTAAIAASAQPVPISLQLLMDPALCELPWEALPVVRRSCGSVARCLSLAQLQQLLVPPQTLLGLQQQQQQQAVVDAGAEAMQPVGWDVGKIGYLVDPLHHMSSTTERPGCYAAPLLPTFRQQVLDTWGQEWQGFAGVDCQVPGEEQLLRPLVGSKGMLVLAPGRLLGHLATQAVAGLDLSSCTAAVLLDRLDNSAAAAAHQSKSDNSKTEAERALEGPCQTAQLLMMRGVRAVAVSALPGTPHTHVHLAANVLRGLTGTPIQPLQLPNGSTASSTNGSTNGAAVAAGGARFCGDTSDFVLPASMGPLTLGEAVVVAQRQGLAGFELQVLREAGVVVYGLAGVVVAEGGSSAGKGKTQRKG